MGHDEVLQSVLLHTRPFPVCLKWTWCPDIDILHCLPQLLLFFTLFLGHILLLQLTVLQLVLQFHPTCL